SGATTTSRRRAGRRCGRRCNPGPSYARPSTASWRIPMDKLEHYLDRVCRGIGGPKSLRQHVRQELREHLLDAVAEHRAAGLSEEEALTRALEDFGGPEQL